MDDHEGAGGVQGQRWGEPAFVLGWHLLVVAALGQTVGLSPVGWLLGSGYAVVLTTLVVRARCRPGATTLGPADLVTAGRSGLVAGVIALLATAVTAPAPVPLLVVMIVVALGLDGVDGRVARHTRTVSAFGARFDMEVDSVLVFALSAHAARSLGWWVLLIGAARPLFVLAGFCWPWLRGPLPARYRTKVVAVLQAVALTLVVSGLAPRPVDLVVVIIALLLLTESFGHSILHLRARPRSDHDRRRPALTVVGVVLGCGLLWALLVVPDRLDDVGPLAFVRLPVELVLVTLLAVLVPGRVARIVGPLLAVAAVVLLLLKALDVGFFAVLGGPFDPRSDLGQLASAAAVLSASVGRTTAGLVIVGLAVVVGLVTWAGVVGVGRLVRLARTRRWHVLRVGGVVLLGWSLLAVAGVRVDGVPVAITAAATLSWQRVDPLVLPPDPYAEVAADELLTGLRGHDVLLIFVESYGRVAVQESAAAPGVATAVGREVEAATAELARSGYRARSGFLTSPAFGGLSWHAHSTLQSGLRVDNETTYRQLLDTRRLTLSSAFGRAGWKTVAEVPGNTYDWPEGQRFYGFDEVTDSRDLGYAGPPFGFGPVPDQYTLTRFADRELQPGRAQPVMAEINLVSSHGPWAPLPQLVDADTIGDGSIYAPMAAAGPSAEQLWRDPARGKAAYGTAIGYSINSVTDLLTRVDDPGLVVVMLGDHQPAAVVSGKDASHDVPVSIITGDDTVLTRTNDWGWDPGLRPTPDAPVWPMAAFRDRFLQAFER